MTETPDLAFLQTGRPRVPLGCSCLRSLPIHGFCFGCPVACDRSCRPTGVCPLLFLLGAQPIVLPLVSSALRSIPLSRHIIATMASADFPSALTQGISLSKRCPFSSAPSGSTSCVFDGLRTSRFLARSSPARGLATGSCSYGRRFAYRFFQLSPYGSALRFGYRYRHRFGQVPFTLIGSTHVRHTRPGHPTRRDCPP